MVDKPHTNIKDLYPDLSPEEQKEAEQRLQQYLAIVKRSYERKHGSIDSGSFSEE